MRKVLFITAFILLVSFSAFGQQPGTTAPRIEGTMIDDREIEWSDFAGAIDQSVEWSAYTWWTIYYTFLNVKRDTDAAHVTVSVKLYLLDKSWVKPEKKTDYLLNHERGHFKLGRICAKEIETTINEAPFDPNNYRQQVTETYQKIRAKYREIGVQYDLETQHSRDRQQQEIWDKKLNDALKQPIKSLSFNALN